MFVCPDIVLIARNTQRKSLLLGTFQARGEDNTRVRIRAYFTRVVNRNPQLQGSAGRGWWDRGTNPKHSGVTGPEGAPWTFPGKGCMQVMGLQQKVRLWRMSSPARQSRAGEALGERRKAVQQGERGQELECMRMRGAWQGECRATPGAEPRRRWEDTRKAKSRHAGQEQRGAHPLERVEDKK